MQQINLYKPPPPPEVVRLPLSQMIGVLVAWTAVLGALAFLDYLDNRQIYSNIIQLKVEKNRIERDLGLLRANMPKAQQEKTLLKKAESLGKIKTLREKMFVELSKLESEEQTGFANYFYALSKFDIEGIWLTSFKFFKGGKSIILHGQAVEPALVPRLMEKLGTDPIFKDKRFESLDISADEKDKTVVNFTLLSD